MKLGDHHFERVAVDQADQPNLLGGGNEMAGIDDGAVEPLHAQQAFVMQRRRGRWASTIG